MLNQCFTRPLPYVVRSALRCQLAADSEAFARVDGLVERASIRGDTLAMAFPASQFEVDAESLSVALPPFRDLA
jgi:hypothetical protein